jgi:hypothetical protein
MFYERSYQIFELPYLFETYLIRGYHRKPASRKRISICRAFFGNKKAIQNARRINANGSVIQQLDGNRQPISKEPYSTWLTMKTIEPFPP